MSDPAFRGWSRYALNLVSGLAKLGAELFLYTDRALDPTQLSLLPVDSVVLRQAPAMNYLLWEQWWIARQCIRDKIDVFHSPIHFGLPQLTRSKCVLTLHDAIEERYYGSNSRRKSPSQWVTGLLSQAARLRADHILTVSQFSKLDLIRYLGIPERKISVVYEAADARFTPDIPASDLAWVRSRYGLPKQFLFYVGSLEPRKNIPFLLRALAAANLPEMGLVLGGGNEAEQREMIRIASGFGIESRVFTVGRIADGDLPAIYAQAHAFVYPSEYEGFGLQICEAMSTGCPVLAARASSLPEILGGGGDTFGLGDSLELTGQLQLVSASQGYREELRQRALTRAKDFSWSQAARGTAAVYERLCSPNIACKNRIT